MLRRITRSFTALGFAVSLFMAAPLAAADTSLTTDGPNSGITVNTSTNTTITNNNNVYVTNTSTQTATTGNATVSNNTTGGNATTGDATNSNTTTTAISISNVYGVTGGSGNADLSTSGPNSPINVRARSNTEVINNNNVTVTNYNDQYATTGNARISNNTEGGNATSGNASNSNATCTSISISNGGGAVDNNACGNHQGGGQGGGPTEGNHEAGGQGGVLGAVLTVASLAGGRGAGLAAAQLPNTGLRDGLNLWVAIAILTVLSSAVYWRYAIAPKLKSL